MENIPLINRDLSWLNFNRRVLEEAFEAENPVLEKLKFLSISSSNLDEFFMVRIATAKAQIMAGISKQDDAGYTPIMLDSILNKECKKFIAKQYDCYKNIITPELLQEGINVRNIEQLSLEQFKHVSFYFRNVIFPVLTPLAIDKSRPFPMLANHTINIGVRLKNNGKNCYAIIQIPSILPRIIDLPSENSREFILMEDVIIHFLDLILEVHNIKAHCIFRITRNSDLIIDEEGEDLLTEIQRSIKKRKRGKPITMQISSDCDSKLEDFLKEMLEIPKIDIYYIDGPINLSAFMKIATMEGYNHLKATPILPAPALDFEDIDDYFEAIKTRDRFVHHPYESFDCVVNFLNQAANDPNVLAIKQTLYRAGNKSPIVAALIKAAENGKQVTVLVELKARFDEENNIHFAKQLEKAGCHVIYGLKGLKTHCKILLVMRKENNNIERYLHLSTGNYNTSTAKQYTDMGLFTADKEFGEDATNLFNHLTGYSDTPTYKKLIVAPTNMRKDLIARIENEINNANNNKQSGITIKCNSLLDTEIVAKLYQASQAGVRIRMIIRGICSLIPGLSYCSQKISITSIVGQLLEHSRVFAFENGGNMSILMGSADLMPRNLNKRVELIFPVEDARVRGRVLEALNIMLNDNVNARILGSNGEYNIAETSLVPINSQRELSNRCRITAEDVSKNYKAVELLVAKDLDKLIEMSQAVNLNEPINLIDTDTFKNKL